MVMLSLRASALEKNMAVGRFDEHGPGVTRRGLSAYATRTRTISTLLAVLTPQDTCYSLRRMKRVSWRTTCETVCA
jgi:hypothetical protein